MMNVLMVAAECAPFVKLGGLADVIGTLPKELNKLHADTRVMMPFHRQIKDKYAAQTKHMADFYIHFAGRDVYVGVEGLFFNDVTYYFIDNEEYFGDAVYGAGTQKESSTHISGRAVIEAAGRIGSFRMCFTAMTGRPGCPASPEDSVQPLGDRACQDDLYNSQHDVSG